jgi:hypothetical protein
MWPLKLNQKGNMKHELYALYTYPGVVLSHLCVRDWARVGVCVCVCFQQNVSYGAETCSLKLTAHHTTCVFYFSSMYFVKQVLLSATVCALLCLYHVY